MDEKTIEVAKNIKETVEKSHFSIRQFAQEINMTETTVHKIIKGKQDIKISTLYQIAKVLDKSVHYFLNPNAAIFLDDIPNEHDEEIEELNKQLNEKEMLVQFLNKKDKANQDVLIHIIELLSSNKDDKCSKALAEIKNIKKVEFLIEYGLVNPDIFNK